MQERLTDMPQYAHISPDNVTYRSPVSKISLTLLEEKRHEKK